MNASSRPARKTWLCEDDRHSNGVSRTDAGRTALQQEAVSCETNPGRGWVMVIVSTAPHPNPFAPGKLEMAWTQPLIVKADATGE